MQIDPKTSLETSPSNTPLTVSVKSILLAVVSFILGITAVFVTQNILAKEQIQWSTGSLLSLVSTVALGAASVTLTWVAHRISKDSEQKLTGVFLQTTNALSIIQASTGVTEKRVEDIISGRATNLIAAAVAEKSRQQHHLSPEAANKMKNDIAQSLRNELLPLLTSSPSQYSDRLSSIEHQQQTTVKMWENWHTFSTSIFDALNEFSDVEIIDDTLGLLASSSSLGFWDGLLQIGTKRIALAIQTKAQLDQSILSSNQAPGDHDVYDYLIKTSWRVRQDKPDFAFIVLDCDIWRKPPLLPIAQHFDRFNEEGQSTKVFTIFGEPESIANQIYSTSTGSSDTDPDG